MFRDEEWNLELPVESHGFRFDPMPLIAKRCKFSAATQINYLSNYYITM